MHPADRRLWQRGRVRRARPPCCWTPTTSPGPNHLCGLCQLLHRGQHRGSDGELLRFPERSVRRPAHEDGVLALVKKRRGGDLQRAPEPLGGRRPHRLLPELGRHHPHRIGQLRSQRDLRAAGDGRSDHLCHRCPGSVPIPKRSGGPRPHRHGPGALLGPRGSVKLRGRRALQLRHEQLGEQQHQLGFVELRRQQPGR